HHYYRYVDCSLTTYLLSLFTVSSVIRISRKGWHTLLNFLFHTGLTFGVFAGGINQIHFPLVCQIVGIVLHYASLSTMMWLAFTARNICKDVCKEPLHAQGRSGPVQKGSKPNILRFYLVSDGVPLIVVVITAVFGMDNYGSRDGALYCWMAWEPSLGGFYAPVGLLVLVMSLYLLITYIQLKRHPERKYELRLLREDQQMLSSSESNHHSQSGSGGASVSAGDCLPFSTGASVLANEHSFKSQLRATIFTLFLFLATWALGALAVSQGHFLDMIFSCLYGAFCVTLGLFLLIQHCAKRDDVWNSWWVCCPSKSKIENVNTDGQSQMQQLHQPHCHLSSPCSDELPRPTLPLQRCLTERAKSRSFNRPRPCLQDYRSNMASLSMDGSVHSSHRDSSQPAQHLEGTTLVSNSPLPDHQLLCPSPHLDKQMAPCHTFQRQISFSRRGVIGRNRSLQEDGLFGSDATGNIRTGPWKNETTV
uniref:G-protein coupled receptors family 2 profile 2 domain-containing protein n=1 Tax=Xiphophorus couchianus TaxID=32473 RepID=A0A3B5MJV8_9TELE